MVLGEVVGSIWGSVQAAGLDGIKLVQVRPLAFAGSTSGGARTAERPRAIRTDSVVVAADPLGAGEGELVLVAFGSRVRDIVLGSEVPTKRIVVAIVDRIDHEGAGDLHASPSARSGGSAETGFGRDS